MRKKKKADPGKGILFASTHNGVYLPDCLPQVRAIAMRGLSDDEISANFGVDKDLFAKWKKAYPSFREAIEHGRTHADVAVVEAAWKRAVGYDYHEDGLTRTGAVRSLRRHLPGDPGMIKYWLNNRKRDHFQDRNVQEHGGDTSPGAKAIGVDAKPHLSKTDLINAIVSLIRPQADGETNPPKLK